MVVKKKKKVEKTENKPYVYKEDDDDFDQRMLEQAQQGNKKSGGKKTCLDLSKAGDKEVKWFKIQKDERYKINIIPFPVSQEWYKDLKQQAGPPTGRKIGKLEYALIIPVHAYLGTQNKTVLCLKNAFDKKCPVCELAFEKSKEDYEKNEKIISSLRAKWKCYYNVKIKGEKGIHLWEMAFNNFEKALRAAMDASDEGSVSFASFKVGKGKSISFKGLEDSFANRKYVMVDRVDFQDRKKPINPSILEKVFPLDVCLDIPTYEEVESIFLDEASEVEEAEFPPVEDDDDDEDNKEESKTPDLDDDEDDENNEDEDDEGEEDDDDDD